MKPTDPAAVIFLTGPGGLREMREVAYEAEAVLQELIALHPAVLAGEQVDADSPRRWALIAREAGLPGAAEAPDRWSVDHLLIDQDAIPTIVEVKRSTDTRIRREVVGQILEYAANASVYWPADRLRGWFEERAGGPGEASDSVLAGELGISDADAFWATAKANLEGGRLRLVFVADKIPTELRRIVEFLDEQMTQTQVLAIEVRRYQDPQDASGTAALVPRVVAQSVKAEIKRVATRRGKRTWDEAAIIAELRVRAGGASADIAADLLVWAKKSNLRLWYGSGNETGSAYPILDLPSRQEAWTFSIWTNGSVGLLFGWMANRPGFSEHADRLELVSRLNAIPGVSVDPSRADSWPKIELGALAGSDEREAFKSVFDWVIEKARRADA